MREAVRSLEILRERLGLGQETPKEARPVMGLGAGGGPAGWWRGGGEVSEVSPGGRGR